MGKITHVLHGSGVRICSYIFLRDLGESLTQCKYYINISGHSYCCYCLKEPSIDHRARSLTQALELKLERITVFAPGSGLPKATLEVIAGRGGLPRFTSKIQMTEAFPFKYILLLDF